MLSSGISYFHRGQKLIVFCLLHIIKICNVTNILLPENEKEIVENYSSRRHLDFKKLDFRITNMFSVFQKKEESYLLKLYTK